jgi:DNA-binding MarR family transcriptional regulator
MADLIRIAEEISIIMPRITRQILSDLFQAVDIPQAQLMVLMTIFQSGPCRPCDIGRQLRVSAPTATGIVGRLGKAGYVRRSSNKDDRRMVMVDLTEEGNRVAHQVKQRAVERWAAVLGRVPVEDAEKYLAILKEIQEAV